MQTVEKVILGSHLSGGKGFYQIKIEALQHLRHLIGNQCPRLQVFLWLLENASRRNIVHRSDEEIVAAIPLSRSTIYQALADLEECKIIERGNGIRINMLVAWRGRSPESLFAADLFMEPVFVPQYMRVPQRKTKRKKAA